MISVRGLKKYFGEVKAVDGIDFDIQKGEIVGLLGPNGAGKTTTLRVLTGYLNPTGGEVNINGMDVPDEINSIKRIIGYLPESAPLYCDMVVYDYLKFIAGVQEVPDDKIEDRIHYVSEKCALAPVIDKKIAELSKGFRQRVGLAHAIIHDPEILILDEPTSGLDPNQIIEIRQLIKDLGRFKTVILSTHILSEVEASCNRVIIINKGIIAADRETAALLADSGNADIVSIKVKTNSAKKAIESCLSMEGVSKLEISETEKGIKDILVYSGQGLDIREQIYRKIKDTDWILLEMKRERRTLENIFQELTKEE
jgi:ABC-2 type transport system ATP-binding protein